MHRYRPSGSYTGPTDSASMKRMGWIFSIVGAICLAVAAFLLVRELAFLSHAESVTGTVTDFWPDNTSNGIVYYPVIEFSTRDGQSVRFESNFSSPSGDNVTDQARMFVGKQVRMFYDPQHPESTQIQSFWNEYLGVLILGIIGLPFFWVGTGLLRSYRGK
jgi:hypothetical protein